MIFAAHYTRFTTGLVLGSLFAFVIIWIFWEAYKDSDNYKWWKGKR